MMTTVYVLQHECELEGRDEVKLVGIYASEADAEAAKNRAQHLSGFSQHPDGFSIDAYELGRDGWTEGFVTVDAAGKRSRANKEAA